jgi:hypothetical protein
VAPALDPDDMQRSMQGLLSALTEMDFQFDEEMARLSKRDMVARERAAQRLRDQHRMRREPYIHLLNELHTQILSSVGACA